MPFRTKPFFAKLFDGNDFHFLTTSNYYLQFSHWGGALRNVSLDHFVDSLGHKVGLEAYPILDEEHTALAIIP